MSIKRKSHNLDAALLRRRSRDENGKFFYVSAESVQRQIVNDLAGKTGVNFRRLRLDEISARFDFDDCRHRAEFEGYRGFRDLV